MQLELKMCSRGNQGGQLEQIILLSTYKMCYGFFFMLVRAYYMAQMCQDDFIKMGTLNHASL